jgi:hypothetical protein
MEDYYNMTKRLFGAFGVLLSICMMFSMLSLSAKADGMAEAIVSLSEDTPIEVGSLTELQEIVNNAGQDLYIKLAADYNRVEAETETGTAIGTGRLTISNHSNYNITIDLNGQTMDGGSGTAILHDDYGTLTIMDSSMDQRGIVTSKSTENGQATINNSYRGGHLEIKGGTIENTAVTGSTIDVISNTGYGNITISGGHVRVNNAADGSEACAIRNTDLGNVIITAGTVTVNASFGYAIYNARGSSVNGAEVRISGGTVSAAGGADAIHNRYYGWVMISGGIVSAEQGRAIYNDGVDEYYDGHFGRLVITGGTISSNTGNAIYNNNTGKIKISGTATITSAKAGIDSGTIYLKQGTSDTIMLLLEGGTIENTSETGNGIYNNDIGTVNILGGTTRISGGNLAMNTAPTLGNQFIYRIMADKTRADALDAQEIARDDIKTQIQQYKYIQFEPLEIFRVGAAGYTTLQDAIAAVADGGTIELLRDISPAAALTVTGTKSFTLDLKGKVLNGGTNTALSHEGSKTLIITDTDSSGAGKITNNSSSYAALKNNGTLHVAGGTVAGTTMAIANYENLTVSGGMVVAFRAIYNWMGRLEMTGGVVNSDNGIAIDNYEDSTVVISGGIVDGNEGYAIQSLTSGCVTISGTALVTNNHSNPTIWLKGEGVIIGTPLSLIISGGKVENLSTGNAIYGSKDAYINISGGTISSSNGKAIDITTNSVLRLLRGEITIKGKTGILGQEDQVDFSTYGPNRLLVSTAKSDGTETSERSLWDIQSGFISIYNCKYMQFEPITLTEPAAKNIDTGNVYADLLEAIYNVGDGQTIQLQKDIPNLDYDIEIPYYPDVSFTLDLNGHTMTFVGNTRFNVHGGTLTITDSGSGGKITGSMTNTSNGTINLFFTGSLHLIGGTIERRNMINPAIYSASSGNVIISGGTVSADRTAIYNDSSSGRAFLLSEYKRGRSWLVL